MMRLVHVLVIGMLVFAAAYVYRIKMESTVRTEKVLQIQAELRKEREAIARLRAEWAQLDSPGRLQASPPATSSSSRSARGSSTR